MKSILIFHPAGIGDAVLAIPAMKAIRESHPKAHIALVTSKRAKTLVELCPYVDEILALGMDAINTPFALLNGEKLTNVWRLISKLRKCRFNAIADFTRIGSGLSPIKRALLYRLIRGQYIVGRNTLGRGFFLDGKVYDAVTPNKHEVDYCLEVVSFLGASLKQPPKLELFLTGEDKASVNSLLNESGIRTEELTIGINPGGYRPARRWLKERFATVADKLISNYDAQIVFVGGKGDLMFVEEICSLMRFKAVNVAGKTTIRQLAALIELFNLFITNDSGPMHIAAAVNTPIVALFGPGSVTKFQPYCDDTMKVIVRKDLECSPCYEKVNCTDHRCMKLITVEDVMTAAEKFLLRQGYSERSGEAKRLFTDRK